MRNCAISIKGGKLHGLRLTIFAFFADTGPARTEALGAALAASCRRPHGAPPIGLNYDTFTSPSKNGPRDILVVSTEELVFDWQDLDDSHMEVPLHMSGAFYEKARQGRPPSEGDIEPSSDFVALMIFRQPQRG